jgi:hypothetical protein
MQVRFIHVLKHAFLIYSASFRHLVPAVLLCRRPGCVLCRDEAQKLWKEQQALTDAGLKVACVVHEWIDREVRRICLKVMLCQLESQCTAAWGWSSDLRYAVHLLVSLHHCSCS